MKYLVGFSPDQGGREALGLAAVLARSTGGSLVVCTIIPETWGHPSPARVDAEYASFLNQNAEKALAKARATLPGDIAAEFVARSAGSARDGLLHTAEDLGVDALVLGSARAAAIGRFAEGGVTTDVLRLAPLPVILAPRGYAPRPGIVVRRVSCAISGSDTSAPLAEQAGNLAQSFGVPLRLATFIVRDKQMYPTGAGYDAENLVSNEYRRQAQAVHDAIRAGWTQPVALTSAFGDGPTWRTALDRLGWENAELLVIGSSSLGPILRVFLGSNSGKIARCAPVPCVVMPRVAE
jgi:nucleotide-binding universal stress UspA family protein